MSSCGVERTRPGRLSSTLATCVLALTTASCGIFSDDCGSDPELRQQAAEALLTGSQVVPPTGSSAVVSGSVFLTEQRGGDKSAIVSLVGAATMSGIDTLTPPTLDRSTVVVAHLHRGTSAENGSIVFTLQPPTSTGGPYDPYRIADSYHRYTLQPELFDLVREGRTYLDVHTDAFPLGEVRGKLAPIGGTGDWFCLRPD